MMLRIGHIRAAISVPAPRGGMAVQFSTSDPAIFFSSEPSSYASEGSTAAAAAFIAKSVSATKVVNLIATYGSSSASAPVTINPSDGVARWPTSVTLTSAAPSGGAVVALSSSNTSAIVQATVTVAAGATSGNFSVTTRTVVSS